jgi:hypothetical protein
MGHAGNLVERSWAASRHSYDVFGNVVHVDLRIAVNAHFFVQPVEDAGFLGEGK